MGSLGHIRKQSAEVQDLLKPLYDGIAAIAAERGFSVEGLTSAIPESTIREIMEVLQFDSEAIHAMNTKLHGIINQLDIF